MIQRTTKQLIEESFALKGKNEAKRISEFNNVWVLKEDLIKIIKYTDWYNKIGTVKIFQESNDGVVDLVIEEILKELE